MEFEDDLQKMISKVQFRRVNNDFQNRLKNDSPVVQKSFFFSQIKQETFMKWKNHLTDNITKT